MLSLPAEKARLDKRGRKIRSVVWYYFDKSPTDPFKSTCKLCNLVCHNASNTTNLFAHLRVKHPVAYEEAKAQREADMESRQGSLSSSSSSLVSPIQMSERIERKPTVLSRDKALKRPRSVVWYYFDKDPSEPLKAKCKICNVLCMHGTNTTNLFNHLKVKHPTIYEEARNQKDVETDLYLEMKGTGFLAKPTNAVVDPPPKKRGRPPKSKTDIGLPGLEMTPNMTTTTHFTPTLTPMSLSSPVLSRKPYGVDKARHNVNKLLTNMIAANMLTPSIVEIKGFKEFVRALDSRYEIPSKKTILKTMIPELAEETRSKIKLEVHIASYFALTMETWTYRDTTHCITMMAHFIKDSWETSSIVLETFDCTEKNTSESIAGEMKRITDEWGISDKIVSVISDCSENTNITTATLNTGWEHVSCFGQMLNNVILSALKSVAEIARIQKKTSEVVAYFEKTVKASDTLMSVQQHHTLPEHKLKQQVENRWNSIFYMMERMVEQFEAVNTVLCYLGKDSMCLCDDEVELMRLVIQVLRPFEAATKELFVDEYAAMSKIIPLLTLLQQVTVSNGADSMETPEPQSALRNALVMQMQSQFVNLETNYMLAVTTLLDPRFKHHGFTDAAALEIAQQRLLKEIIATANSSAESGSSSSTDTNTSQNVVSATEKNSGSVSIWNLFDRKVSEAGAQKTTSSEADNESRRYFKEAVISRNSNPLQWWKLNQVQFPHLKVLAQKYLCIPANAMCSSRLFTKRAEEIENRRNMIKPSSLHTMVFLSSNV